LDRNLFLAFALSFAVLTGWMLLTAPQKKPVPVEQTTEAPGAEAPVASAESAREPLAAAPAPTAAAAPPPVVREAEPETLRIERPLFVAELTTRGAALERWELRSFDTGPSAGRQPVRLVDANGTSTAALATPLPELALGSLAERVFEVESQDDSSVTFRFASGGVVVRKTYAFEPDGYAFKLKLRVDNGSTAAIAPRFGVDWSAEVHNSPDFKDVSLTALHEGSVRRSPLATLGKPSFFSRNPDREIDLPREIDWVGLDLPYFLGAVVPELPAAASARIRSLEPGHAGVVEVFYDATPIPPGQFAERVYDVYAGPKESDRLEALGRGLIRAIDLGYTWVVPLTRNYGVAIIVLTFLVRLVTAPLTARQMRSMERMRALSPKLEELRAKYADDRQKQSEEMMRLYRQEGVNPLGGCLPMVLQIPVFIGLFYALRSSIELRHSPFFGWINDLSVPESLFTIPGLGIPVRVLPLLMGASMVLQQKLTPMQVDPAQAKMMLIVMPVMMTVMFYQFPSGLVLYWMVSNVLAISHQLWVGRHIRAAAAA
jgi:YidC/Oxa1 family membrane protein insertase